MTSLACLSKFVAGETATLIHLSQEPVPAVDERIDWIVASWPFIVAPLAGIRLMAHGAIQAIHRSHSSVEVIPPPDRVRFGTHN